MQLYVLLGPYLYFVSFLYLNLYVLEDDTSISQGSFMQIKHLSVLILINNNGEVGTVKLG